MEDKDHSVDGAVRRDILWATVDGILRSTILIGYEDADECVKESIFKFMDYALTNLIAGTTLEKCLPLNFVKKSRSDKIMDAKFYLLAFLAEIFLTSQYADCSTLLSSIKLLSDDSNSTLLPSKLFFENAHFWRKLCARNWFWHLQIKGLLPLKIYSSDEVRVLENLTTGSQHAVENARAQQGCLWDGVSDHVIYTTYKYKPISGRRATIRQGRTLKIFERRLCDQEDFCRRLRTIYPLKSARILFSSKTEDHTSSYYSGIITAEVAGLRPIALADVTNVDRTRYEDESGPLWKLVVGEIQVKSAKFWNVTTRKNFGPFNALWNFSGTHIMLLDSFETIEDLVFLLLWSTDSLSMILKALNCYVC